MREKINKRLKAGLMLIVSLLVFWTPTVQAELNKYELKVIQDQIAASFEEMLQLWKEELYFEMYDYGQRNSQQTLSKIDFAQRMVDLRWKPALSPVDIRSIRVIYRNFSVIHCVMEFENKISSTKRIKRLMTFPVSLEKNKWTISLTQLIRTPYGGKKAPPPAPKPKKPPKPKGDEQSENATGDTPTPPAAEANPGQ